MTDVGNRNFSPLTWYVLITPGISIVTSDLPPQLTLNRKFQVITYTLIDSKQDSVLVDAFMTTKQADSLVYGVLLQVIKILQQSILDMTMKTTGLESDLKRYPNARAITTSDLKSYGQHASPNT